MRGKRMDVPPDVVWLGRLRPYPRGSSRTAGESPGWNRSLRCPASGRLPGGPAPPCRRRCGRGTGCWSAGSAGRAGCGRELASSPGSRPARTCSWSSACAARSPGGTGSRATPRWSPTTVVLSASPSSSAWWSPACGRAPVGCVSGRATAASPVQPPGDAERGCRDGHRGGAGRSGRPARRRVSTVLGPPAGALISHDYAPVSMGGNRGSEQSDRFADDPAYAVHEGGKLSVTPTRSIDSIADLALTYTPVGTRVSSTIAAEPELARRFTWAPGVVAVVSDGSVVLGLGDIGPVASLPVMEGKACLFAEFAGLSAVPIVLSTNDVDTIVETVAAIAPSFGGINLEDISAPRCFEIEARL